MELRNSILKMIPAISGSWDVAAAYLGMSVSALRNRAYEVKGQMLSREHTMALQALSGTTYFAEAVAIASGGTFVKLPSDLATGNEVLSKKFHDLYAELGTLSQHFTSATADDVIDRRERAVLAADGQRLHRVLAELLALTFRVYCPVDASTADRQAAE